MYTLCNFANNNVGTTMAERIIKPPIVGVPFFCNWPSNPKSRTVSPTCFFSNKSMIRFPNTNEINNEKMSAIAARKEMY